MVSIASDHGGYRLKEHIKAYLTAKGISVLDCGCDSLDSCDYPVSERQRPRRWLTAAAKRVL